MKTTITSVILLAAALGARAAAGLDDSLPSPSPPPPPQDAISKTADSSALERVETMYWQRLLAQSLSLRTRLGLSVDTLPDLSYAKCRKDAAFGRTLQGLLHSVRVAGLDHEEQISAEILRREARVLMQAPEHYWLTFPATPYAFQFLGVNAVFVSHAFRSKEDADHYVMLLGRYPAFLRSIETKMREQARRRIVLPKAEIPLIVGAFAAATKEREQNQFWVPPERLAELSPTDRDALSGKLETRIDLEIRGAAARLIKFLTGEYALKARDAVGLGQYPGGKEYYRVLVARTTTLDVSPEEIHRIGLASMEKLNSALEDVRRTLAFSGSLVEFRKLLKTDPRFYAKTPEEVGERLMAAQDRILAKVPQFFGREPKAPFSVKRLEPQLEGALTFGYYQVPTPQDPKGYYKYNGTHLEDRSLLGAGSLIAHELVPGHHFQINLQHENAALPAYRRESLSYTAFVEGWGDYASFLAGEMGMYADPYDLAGRLLFDAFLTSRLVVDTGMNTLGWSRESAMEYMRENTIQSETEIATETLRYACDLPSQALAYKMGMRKFVELREKAMAALGPAFDMRRYHDMMLASGAVPMDLAERKVDWFIAEEKARK
jgi:uncharacterized protein (DUF885 family)